MRSPVQSWVALQERKTPCQTARGFCFGPTQACLKEVSKQIIPRELCSRGFPLLGCFADRFRINDRREVILALGCFADRFRITEQSDVILRSKTKYPGFSSHGLFCRPFQDQRPQGGNPEKTSEALLLITLLLIMLLQINPDIRFGFKKTNSNHCKR